MSYFQVEKGFMEQHPELNCSDMMVYSLMLDDCPFYLKERKHYSPSHDHIAKQFNLSLKQVGRIIKKLIDLGLVEQVERGQKTNSYLVHRTKCLSKVDKMSEETGQNVLHTNLFYPLPTSLNKAIEEVKEVISPSTVSIPSSVSHSVVDKYHISPEKVSEYMNNLKVKKQTYHSEEFY